MECLICGKQVKQTPGKRAKHYCDANCRQKHWLKKNKESKPKGPGPGRPKKLFKGVIPDKETMLSQRIEYNPNLSFDAGKIDTIADEPKKWQEGDHKKTTGGLTKYFEPAFQPPIIYDKFGKPIDAPLIDKPVVDELRSYCSEEGGTNLLISFSFPKDFAGILRLAKEWKGDVEAFKNKVNGLNLTANQKSMILSKLK